MLSHWSLIPRARGPDELRPRAHTQNVSTPPGDHGHSHAKPSKSFCEEARGARVRARPLLLGLAYKKPGMRGARREVRSCLYIFSLSCRPPFLLQSHHHHHPCRDSNQPRTHISGIFSSMLQLVRRRSAAVARCPPHFFPTSPGLARFLPAAVRRYSPGSTTTNETSSIVGQKPPAIAQRLPDPDTIHAPHRFREFEVGLVGRSVGRRLTGRDCSLTARSSWLQVEREGLD